MPDIPSIIRGVQEDYTVLYYSDPMAALKVPVTLQSGYGTLKKGMPLALNCSALTTGGQGQMLPYNPTSFTGAEDHPGRAYVVADPVATASVVYVTMDDSYKFKVGDDIILNCSGVTVEDLGAITAIDRTSERQRAKITFTTAITGSFTTAAYAYVCVQAHTTATNGNNYSVPVGILEKSVDTGTGENAKGAVATMILGNCVLYEGLMLNLDTFAKGEYGLNGSSFGQYFYLR